MASIFLLSTKNNRAKILIRSDIQAEQWKQCPYLQQSEEGDTALEQNIYQNLKEKLQATVSLGHEDISCRRPFAKIKVGNR